MNKIKQLSLLMLLANTSFYVSATNHDYLKSESEFLELNINSDIFSIDNDESVAALIKTTALYTSVVENLSLIDNSSEVTGTVTKTNDDYACDATNPTGRLVASATSSGTYSYEWYAGNSAVGTLIGTNAILDGITTGDYTVKIINDATGFYINLTESIERIVPTVILRIDGSFPLQTTCSPPNGSISMILSRPLFSGATPVGFTPDLTYSWYKGNTPDPANLIESETSATLSGLERGFYTVTATENTSGCVTYVRFTQEIGDNFNVTAPTITTSFDIIPTSCIAANGEITGTINLGDNPTGNDFSFEWYEGSEDFAGDPLLGTLLTSGSVLNDGSTSVTVSTPNTISGAGSATLSGITAGLYTLVAENLVTGCRTQQVFDLPFIGVQQTTITTIAHLEECPGSGTVAVGLSDDATNAGYVSGDVDDISQYLIFIYPGTGIPADRLTAYSYEGLRFPYIMIPSTGEIRDADGTLISTVTPLTTGQSALFTDLPAGTYTAIAREINNPAFNPASTAQCWTFASNGEVEKRNSEPNLSLFQTIPNTVCDFSTFGGNGVLNVALQGSNPPSADEFKFTLYDGINDTDVVITTETISYPDGNFIVYSLDPKDYLVEVERIKGGVSTGCMTSTVVTIQNSVDVHEIFSAAVINQSNCSPNDASITIEDDDISVEGDATEGDATDYRFTWYQGSLSNVISGETSNTLSLSTLGAGTYLVKAESISTGCITNPFQIDVNDDTVTPEIALQVDDQDTSCDPDVNEGNGRVSFEIENAAPGTSYDFQWYVGTGTAVALADGGTITGSSGTLIGGAISDYVGILSGIKGGQNYTLEVIDRTAPNNACSAISTITIESETPVLSINQSLDMITADNLNCTNNNGFIEINTIREDDIAVNVNATNYTFQWFDGNGSDITFSSISGTTTVGNGNRLENLPGGTYAVVATNSTTGCVSGLIEITILDQSENPVVNIVSINEDSYCDNSGNSGVGSLIISISENGSLANISDYDITWFRGATTANPLFDNLGSATIGGTTGEELYGLSSGQYTVKVTKSEIAPNGGCSTITTFTIESEEGRIISLGSPSNVIIQNNQNCVNENGSIEILGYTDNGIDRTVSTDYTFAWADAGGNPIPAANITDAGAGIGNKVQGLPGGQYQLIITQVQGGCASDPIQLIIEDETVSPVVELANSSADEFCDSGFFAGNGTLEIGITEDGIAANLADYQITWYRGDATVYSDQIFPTDVGSRGTAVMVSPQGTSLSGLSSGQYTVVVTKDNSIAPNAGCQIIATFTIESNLAKLVMAEADNMIKQADTNFGISPNGFIEITSVKEDDVDIAVNGANYSFQWFDEPGNDISVSASAGTTAIGIGNRFEGIINGIYHVIATNNVTGCTTEMKPIFIGLAYVWDGSESIDWNDGNNWEGGMVPPASADAIIPEEESINNEPVVYREITINNLVIEEGGLLTVAGDYLLINGSFVNNGSLGIDDEQSVVLMGNRYGTGHTSDFTKIRGNNALQIIGFPVNNSYSFGPLLTDGNYLLFSYDNNTQEFFRKVTDPLPGEGIFMAYNKVDNSGEGVSFDTGLGILNSGEINKSITLNTDGFNMVANPYAAAIDATAFFSNANNMTHTTGTAYLWNDGGVNVGVLRGGDYITVNSIGTVGGPVDPGNGAPGLKSATDFNGSFNSFQGFFIEATSNGNVTFTPSMQIVGDNENEGLFRTEESDRKLLKLSLTGNGFYNDLIISLDEHATLADDYSMDAKKFIGSDQIAFYSKHQENKYAILALPASLDGNHQTALEILTGKNGNYTIKVEEIQNFNENVVPVLTDQSTGISYDLSITKIIPIELKERISADRFVISFRENKITSVEEEINSSIEVYGNTSSLTIFYNGKAETVTIHDLHGRKLFREVIDFADNAAIINPPLRTGKVYILQINDELVKFRLK